MIPQDRTSIVTIGRFLAVDIGGYLTRAPRLPDSASNLPSLASAPWPGVGWSRQDCTIHGVVVVVVVWWTKVACPMDGFFDA